MAALTVGKKAPDFELAASNGERFLLTENLAHGAVVLTFFKVACPTCQYAFPFLERLFKAYGQNGVSLVGISQNNARETAAFVKEFGVDFPVLLEDQDTYRSEEHTSELQS